MRVGSIPTIAKQVCSDLDNTQTLIAYGIIVKKTWENLLGREIISRE